MTQKTPLQILGTTGIALFLLVIPFVMINQSKSTAPTAPSNSAMVGSFMSMHTCLAHEAQFGYYSSYNDRSINTLIGECKTLVKIFMEYCTTGQPAQTPEWCSSSVYGIAKEELKKNSK